MNTLRKPIGLPTSFSGPLTEETTNMIEFLSEVWLWQLLRVSPRNAPAPCLLGKLPPVWQALADHAMEREWIGVKTEGELCVEHSKLPDALESLAWLAVQRKARDLDGKYTPDLVFRRHR